MEGEKKEKKYLWNWPAVLQSGWSFFPGIVAPTFLQLNKARI